MSYLFVLIGVSGVGKTTLAREVIKNTDNLIMPLGVTTREPRCFEKVGIDYHFVDLKLFKEFEKNNRFIETATYKNNRYGILKADIKRIVEAEKDILLILTPEGYHAFKKLFPDNITAIHVYAPSEEIRLKRLRKRSLIPTDEKQGNAIDMEGITGWSVCNYDLETAVKEVKKIIEDIA